MARNSAAGATRVSATLPVDDLTTALQDALTGPAQAKQPTVTWSDRGSQLIMNVGKLQVKTTDNVIIVAIDTESIEYGVAPLIVRFVFGAGNDPASMVASTDDQALGHPMVAARWGKLFRDVIWAGIVRLADQHATGQGLVPAGIEVTADQLRFSAQPAYSIRELAEAHVRSRRGDGPESTQDTTA